MKWKDLSLKERKQIYDSVRVNNPDATYLDIKQQFDSIPAYEDGKGKTINKADLPPEYRTGTPEYFERQRKISGAVNTVQPEAYITPAGCIKDAVNFIEELGNGDYAGAAMDAVLNLIPWGVGKTIKKNLKNKVGRAIEGTDVYTTESYAEPFTPTITKKKGKSKVSKPSEEAENSETIRLARNRSKYETEISRSISDAVFPDSETYELLNYVDNTYKTNYKSAYSNIAMRDMTNRGKYLSWGTMDNNAFDNTRFKIEPDGNTSRVMQDYNVTLNPDSYMSGTANHELGHVADGLAGSRKIVDFDGGGEYITNPYLHYLANPNNTYSSAELRKMGMHSAANNRAYLLNPTEAKSHMLTLKRALKDSGKITNWSTPIDESMVLEYIKSPIKKKNRGKFNALKKRTGKSTEELTHSKNPLTRKRATFAQNAAKWNHKGRKKKITITI